MVGNPPGGDAQAAGAKVPEEIRALAERLFGPSTQEPMDESFKVDEFLDYALRERGCKDPASMLNLLNAMDKGARQTYPDMGMLDRLWRTVRQVRARKSMEAWLRAEEA